MQLWYDHGKTAALYALGLKKANIAKLPSLLMKNTAMKAKPAFKTAPPPNFGGAVGKNTSGMFDEFDKAQQAANPKFNPKKTLRGEQIPEELPPISVIPEKG